MKFLALAPCLCVLFLFSVRLLRRVDAALEGHQVDKINNESAWIATMDVKWKQPTRDYEYIKHEPDLRDSDELNPERKNHLPESFDSRTQFGYCRDIMFHVRDQGNCDGSWAHASVSMLSDRICIESSGTTKVHLSAEDVLSCCIECRIDDRKPCNGGSAIAVLKAWRKTGIVTGGDMDSKKGCKPYSGVHYGAGEVACERKCSNKNYWRKSYEHDKHFGKIVYKIRAKDEEGIMYDIMDGGPVVASMLVREDIEHYKDGVYYSLLGKELGVVYFKIVGWGTGWSRENRMKFWLAVYSQSERWGLNGTIKLKRGMNDGRIEEHVIAGRVGGKLDWREKLIAPNGTKRTRSALLAFVLAEMILICVYYLH